MHAGRENTLLDVLQLVLPECYPGDQVKPPPQAIIQGVLPPLNTPILWLWYHPRPAWYFVILIFGLMGIRVCHSENCAHPDNFLYVVVKEN